MRCYLAQSVLRPTARTLYKKPLYNAMTDFAPVALVAEQPLVLVVRKDFPASNLKEFAAYAKANAAKLSFGSGGSGSATHLGCLLLNSAIGVDVQHVPYRGSAPALQDLMAGRIDYLCDAVSTELAPIKAGNVKPIAVLARQRSAVLPNIPTAQQEGLPNFDANNWIALFFPRNTPEPIIHRLREATVEAMKNFQSCGREWRRSAPTWCRPIAPPQFISRVSWLAKSKNGRDRSKRVAYRWTNLSVPHHLARRRT